MEEKGIGGTEENEEKLLPIKKMNEEEKEENPLQSGKMEEKAEENEEKLLPIKKIDEVKNEEKPVENGSERNMHNDPTREYLNILTEFCFKKKIPSPIYNLIGEEGPPHFKTFKFECKVGEVKSEACAACKRMAKRLAALKTLEKLKSLNFEDEEVKNSLFLVSDKEIQNNNGNINGCKKSEFTDPQLITRLNFYCKKKNLPAPCFLLKNTSGPPHLPVFTYECQVGDIVACASAYSKAACKRSVAEMLLQKLELEKSETNSGSSTNFISDEVNYTFSLSNLLEFCNSKKLQAPKYDLISTEGPPHMLLFTFKCKVGDEEATAVGPSKVRAKQICALKILEKLKTK